MIGPTLSHYHILRLLGEGGMGQVYLAQDTILKRRVALKVLRPGMATSVEWLQRFQREAEILATLNHPYIVTIHSLEESAGTRFLTMEWIEGESLDCVESRGLLTLQRSLEIGIAIADALAAAHERGIVHRDIKPANVMLAANGRTKVLDFGLAKSALASGTTLALDPEAAAREADLTAEGKIIGTPAYMSPEQLRAEPLDHRTDIFSLGVVMYEMLAGQHPFRRGGRAPVIEAILRDKPASLTAVRPEVPRQIERVVASCLEKDRAQRMQSALDFRNELGRVRRDIEAGAEPDRRAIGTEAPPAFRPGAGRAPSAATSLSGSFIASLAVLPFADMSSSGDQEYFADGLSEELLNALAMVPGLRLTARTSSFAFKGKKKDVREIGQRLNVGAVLEGSVRIQGTRARIRTQLVSAEDGFRLWSETFDRELVDIFAVQEEIAQSVAGALKVHLLQLSESPSRASELSLAAHDAYLQGNFFYSRQRPGDIEKSIEYFVKVIAMEDGHAAAWASLAKAYLKLMDIGRTPIAEGYQRAKEAIIRALALNADLSDAHATFGYLKMAHEWDWAGAAAELEFALTKNRSDAGALRDAAMLARARGRLEEALDLSAEAVAVDPLNPRSYSGLGFSNWYAGHAVEARSAFTKAIELAPEFAYCHLALALLSLAEGDAATALAESNLESCLPFRLQGLAMACSALGQPGESDHAFAELRARFAETMAVQIAEIHASRGETDLAMDWLEQAYAQRDSGLADLTVKPLLRSLHGEPRFARLVATMGLPL